MHKNLFMERAEQRKEEERRIGNAQVARRFLGSDVEIVEEKS